CAQERALPLGNVSYARLLADRAQQVGRDQAARLLDLVDRERRGPVAHGHRVLPELGDAAALRVKREAYLVRFDRFHEVGRADDGEDLAGSHDVGPPTRNDHRALFPGAAFAGIGGPEEATGTEGRHAESRRASGLVSISLGAGVLGPRLSNQLLDRTDLFFESQVSEQASSLLDRFLELVETVDDVTLPQELPRPVQIK